MKYIVAIKSKDQLNFLLRKDDELKIYLNETSFDGKLTWKEIEKKISSFNCKVILQWDILMREVQLKNTIKFLEKNKILDKISAVSVYDMGAVNYIKRERPDLAIHLIMGNSGHNRESLLFLKQYLKDQLKRFILSSLLSVESYKNFKDIKVEKETLGLGSVLLYASPRRMLSSYKKGENIVAYADTIDYPQKNLPIKETIHGTFMYNNRDLSLFNYIDEIENYGIDYLLLNPRDQFYPNMMEFYELLTSSREDINLFLKKYYPCKLFSGFYKINRTDKVFSRLPKLRNRKSPVVGDNSVYMGEVIEYIKGHHIGLHLKNKESLCLGDKLRFYTPDGIIKTKEVVKMFNSKGDNINKVNYGDIVFIENVSGVTVRSSVYKVLDER